KLPAAPSRATLVNAASVFQDFMHTVLREFLHKSVIVYIDDILIYSRNLAEHRQHVREVLQRLRDYQLFLKAEKCAFHQSSVHFLGYIIDRSGREEGSRRPGLASPHNHKGAPAVPGFCELLLAIHPRIQFRHQPAHQSAPQQAQVANLEPSRLPGL
ncbi:hypothetical protein QTP86_002921, partial [Hemibagrus guttatus]